MLYVQQWLALPHEIRLKLKELFNIRASVATNVANNKVISDGHTDEDLTAMTLEKMQDYLKSKEKNFDKLFNSVVDSILRPAVTPVEVVEPKVEVKKAKKVVKLGKKK